MGPVDSPETSVSNHLTPRNNSEDGMIEFNRGVPASLFWMHIRTEPSGLAFTLLKRGIAFRCVGISSEKGILNSSCPFVCTSNGATPSGTSFREIWCWGSFTEICQELPNLVKIVQKCLDSLHEDSRFVLLATMQRTSAVTLAVFITLSQLRLFVNNTRWFKYDRDKLWLVYTKIVPVIFEPPCRREKSDASPWQRLLTLRCALRTLPCLFPQDNNIMEVLRGHGNVALTSASSILIYQNNLRLWMYSPPPIAQQPSWDKASKSRFSKSHSVRYITVELLWTRDRRRWDIVEEARRGPSVNPFKVKMIL